MTSRHSTTTLARLDSHHDRSWGLAGRAPHFAGDITLRQAVDCGGACGAAVGRAGGSDGDECGSQAGGAERGEDGGVDCYGGVGRLRMIVPPVGDGGGGGGRCGRGARGSRGLELVVLPLRGGRLGRGGS